MKAAKLIIDNQEIQLPILEGSEKEKGIDITKLRRKTGYITLDWSLYPASDNITVFHGATQIYDGGLTFGTGSKTIYFSGTSKDLTVAVNANPEVSITSIIFFILLMIYSLCV